MTVIIILAIILACFLLAFFVLIQNPKGGGLAGQFGSLGTQVMGVKRSTDVMEKATWTTMGVVAALCIAAVMLYPKVQGEAPARSRGGGQQQSSAPAAGGAQPAPAAGGAQPAPASAPASTTPASPATQP